VRFLLDEAIQHRLADHLAEAGHEASPVVRIGLGGASDPEVPARAAAEDRILITTDTDFPTLLALSGEQIPSVMLLRGISDSIQGRRATILSALRRYRRSSRRARSPSWSGTGCGCGPSRSSRPDAHPRRRRRWGIGAHPPAEHLHRSAHRGDARRGLPPRSRDRCGSGQLGRSCAPILGNPQLSRAVAVTGAASGRRGRRPSGPESTDPDTTARHTYRDAAARLPNAPYLNTANCTSSQSLTSQPTSKELNMAWFIPGMTGPWVRTTRWISAPRASVSPGPSRNAGCSLVI
jgi:predicted nuclease of predicted toxin-antitoxin system